jgi:hypothetical protein
MGKWNTCKYGSVVYADSDVYEKHCETRTLDKGYQRFGGIFSFSLQRWNE